MIFDKALAIAWLICITDVVQGGDLKLIKQNNTPYYTDSSTGFQMSKNAVDNPECPPLEIKSVKLFSDG